MVLAILVLELCGFLHQGGSLFSRDAHLFTERKAKAELKQLTYFCGKLAAGILVYIMCITGAHQRTFISCIAFYREHIKSVFGKSHGVVLSCFVVIVNCYFVIEDEMMY